MATFRATNASWLAPCAVDSWLTASLSAFIVALSHDTEAAGVGATDGDAVPDGEHDSTTSAVAASRAWRIVVRRIATRYQQSVGEPHSHGGAFDESFLRETRDDLGSTSVGEQSDESGAGHVALRELA